MDYKQKVETVEEFVPDLILSFPKNIHKTEEGYSCRGPWHLNLSKFTEGYNELVRKWNTLNKEPSDEHAKEYKEFYEFWKEESGVEEDSGRVTINKKDL